MRRFGLEVEFQGSMQRLIRVMREKGMDVVDSTHTHNGHSETAWTVKYDGSVGSGGELVSPPLDFDTPEHRQQVTDAVMALQEAECRPCTAAGIHVHVEAKNLDGTEFTGKQIAAVVRFFYKFEDAIYRIASSGWETIRPGARTFAKPIPPETARKIMRVRTIEQLRSVWDGRGWSSSHGRYHAVNLRSYFQRGTIEFRCFNSSVNPKRIQAYIALCVAIADDARSGHSRSVAKCFPLGSMHAGIISEETVLLRLRQILTFPKADGTQSKGDGRALMSKDDWANLMETCWNDSKPQEDIFNACGTRRLDRRAS